MRTRLTRTALVGAMVAALTGCLPSGPAEIMAVSEPIEVNRRISPADALRTGTEFVIFEEQPPELVWINGCSLEVVSEESGQLMPELLGDQTIDFRWPTWHNEQFQTSQSARLFSLGQGVPQLYFPRGFGIPMRSHEPLWWTARTVNFDPYLPATTVTSRCALEVTRERGAEVEHRPLLTRSLSVRPDGKSMWEVPPGGLTVESDVTDFLSLKHRTSVHALTVSMHPWAKSFELLDTTSQEILLRLEAKIDETSGRVLQMEHYSDNKGFIVDPTHSYRLRAQYSNPTERPVVGVAYAMLYFYDHDFTSKAK